VLYLANLGEERAELGPRLSPICACLPESLPRKMEYVNPAEVFKGYIDICTDFVGRWQWVSVCLPQILSFHGRIHCDPG